MLYNFLPAHHQNSGLRISPWRFSKNGAINNTKPVDTKDLVFGVNHLAHMSTSMVVPNGDHSVFAKLLQGFGVLCMLWYEIDISLDTHIEELLHRFTIVLRVVRKVFRQCNFDGHAYSFNTALKVMRVAKVVEGN